MSDELKFEVGSMYENMKGVYEVVSVDEESMIIRWQNGIEIETSIDLQSRIIERMTREREAKQQKNVETQKQSTKQKRKKSTGFVGFAEGDFKNTSKDTVWRRRNNIGHAVSKGFLSDEVQFASWAVSMKPEVHWMDINRYNPKGPDYGMGFSVRLDDKGLYYGVYIQRSTAHGDGELEGWSSFEKWLRINEDQLKQMALDHDLCIHDASKKGFANDIKVHAGTMELRDDKTHDKIESLSSFLSEISEGEQIDLRIEKTMNKEETLSRRKNIVDEISTLFNSLMPLYEMVSV